MKLAVNFSEILRQLIQTNPDLPVDLIKVPTIPFPGCFTQFEEGARFRKLLPHPAQPGVLALGAPTAEERFNPETVAAIIRWANPAYLSTHLEARLAYFPEYQSYRHEDHPVIRKILKERFLASITLVKNWTKLPLILENCPYYTWLDRFRAISEPEVIREICAAGDCGFLLDIAHARCSAWTLGRSIEEYLQALPLERLREIHLAGVSESDYGILDTHTALDETDYRLLQTVLEWRRPEIVSLEYGGMPEHISNRYGFTQPINRNDRCELETMIVRIRAIIKK
jgi:uncharacterized protein (UPF0276 family)